MTYKLSEKQRRRIEELYPESYVWVINLIETELAPQIRNEALEEAAKCSESVASLLNKVSVKNAVLLPDAIRALKDN